MPDLIGEKIERYNILRKLGQGTSAAVFLARDETLGREVALKILNRSAFSAEMWERMLTRFRHEAWALALLDNDNIVKLNDYGEYDEMPYLVMPYFPGGTLREKLGNPWPVARAASFLLPLAKALAYAHGWNVLHRSIKPANILFDKVGKPLLSDLGIDHILKGDESSALSGVGLGTAEYMAPEQWKGKPVMQSDQYAMGVVLYELLTGRKPFTGDTAVDILLKHTNLPPPPPRQFIPDLPKEAEVVLIRALAKVPGERYPDMAILAEALDNLANKQAVEIRQDSHLQYPTLDLLKQDEASLTPPEANPDDIQEGKKKSRFRIPAWGWGLLGIGVMVLAFFAVRFFGFGVPQTLTTAAIVPSRQAGISLTPEIPLVSVTPTRTITPEITSTPTATLTLMPSPSLGIGSTKIFQKDAMTLVYVPEGEFVMGSETIGRTYDPEHKVTLGPFWIDSTEVTNHQYAAFLQELGLLKGSDPDWLKTVGGGLIEQGGFWMPWSGGTYWEHPVVGVTWYGAQAYCKWVDRRLPTEAEWEKAARGTDGRTYPWGEVLDCQHANFNQCKKGTAAVGSYLEGVSPYLVQDMAGNVWEWTADWYGSGYYQLSPAENPSGPEKGTLRSVRGGGWSDYPLNSLNPFSWVAFRGSAPPDLASPAVGFRCALSSPE
jgi:formylglycine-generating enzyme required for sulfatase activity